MSSKRRFAGGSFLIRIFFVHLFFVHGVWAQGSEFSKKAVNSASPAPVGFLLAFGAELRPEMDVEAQFQNHYLTHYALGYGFDQYVVIFERAQFQEFSGNSTLNVKRTLQDHMFWAQYRDIVWNHLVPYLGAGLGLYQEIIETNLYLDSRTDAGPHRLLTGISLGLGTDFPLLWLALEARVLFGDQFDRNPTIGGLAQIGIHF